MKAAERSLTADTLAAALVRTIVVPHYCAALLLYRAAVPCYCTVLLIYRAAAPRCCCSTALLIFFLHPIYYHRTTLALPPSNNSNPRSHSGPSSPLPTMVRAFILIAKICQHFLCSSTRVELCSPTLLGTLGSRSFFCVFTDKSPNSPQTQDQR